jgi:hypothetical protein
LPNELRSADGAVCDLCGTSNHRVVLEESPIDAHMKGLNSTLCPCDETIGLAFAFLLPFRGLVISANL